MSDERRRQVEPVLRLWLENDGSTAHLVNAAGAKIVSGHLVPAVQIGATVASGHEIETTLKFVGTVV